MTYDVCVENMELKVDGVHRRGGVIGQPIYYREEYGYDPLIPIDINMYFINLVNNNPQDPSLHFFISLFQKIC